ncbi:MAG: hypothetical protein HC913_09330 [Microscillaceae bacterium]|nr:hypothetical protein [Microscillaceae bacterium]
MFNLSPKIKKEDPLPPNKVVFNLDDEIEEDEDGFKTPRNVFEPKSEIDLKKEQLSQEADERILKLRKLSQSVETNEGLKEKIEIPAYLRRNVKLIDPPHSSENDISRFNLNDDNHLLGNNKFFTDNPD